MRLGLAAILLIVNFELVWCLTDLEKQCVATFNEDLSNEFITGTWYRVMLFSLMSGIVPTSECPTFTYQKPNSTELKRYKDEYLKPGIPFSFDDNPLHEDGGPFRPYGFLIGNKQAKFFIMDPKTHFFRPPFTVRIYQRIDDEFLLHHDCNMRGHTIWLMSRRRNPSNAEVEAIINSRPVLMNLQRQWFCAVR